MGKNNKNNLESEINGLIAWDTLLDAKKKARRYKNDYIATDHAESAKALFEKVKKEDETGGIDIAGALADDQHVTPRHRLLPMTARAWWKGRFGKMLPAHGIADDVFARPGAGHHCGDLALLKLFALRHLPAQRRTDAILPA